MKKLLSFIIFSVNFSLLQAQETKLEVGYKYIYSTKWDKAIQTYNFSRPFLEENQPLLIHGISGSLSHIFKREKKIKHGIGFSYSHFGSESANENFSNKLNLRFLNISYIIQFYPSQNIYMEGILSSIGGILSRNINDNTYEIDGDTYRGLGLGGQVGFKVGYSFNIKGNFKLSPFINLNYTPYFYSPNFEPVLNQTSSLIGKPWSWDLNALIGISFHLAK